MGWSSGFVVLKCVEMGGCFVAATVERDRKSAVFDDGVLPVLSVDDEALHGLYRGSGQRVSTCSFSLSSGTRFAKTTCIDL